MHCKKGIIYSQALRIIERCSKPIDVKNHLDNLSEKLSDRNYPKQVIEEGFQKAKKRCRNDLIHKGRSKNKNDKKIRLMLTYNDKNPPVHQWVREAKKLLSRNNTAAMLGQTIQISTRQPKNLQKIVRQSNFHRGGEDPPSITGCFKCKKCKVSCPVINESKTFKSTNTKKSYKIEQYLDCNSDFLIYLSTCKKCNGQYCGKSQSKFRLRHSGHKQEIKKYYGGLGHHYGGANGCGYQNVSIQLIDQVGHGNVKALAEREVYWQHQLRVFVENGGRGHCYRKDI